MGVAKECDEHEAEPKNSSAQKFDGLGAVLRCQSVVFVWKVDSDLWIGDGNPSKADH